MKKDVTLDASSNKSAPALGKKSVTGFVQKYTMVLVLVLVSLFFTWQTNGKILLPQNINNLFAQNAYVFVLSTGMLLCILTGGNIDLSVGSVVCFVGAIGAVMMSKGVNMWVAIVAMLAIGLAIGSWQAFWIAYVKVPPFITTLAGMLAFRGLSNRGAPGQDPGGERRYLYPPVRRRCGLLCPGCIPWREHQYSLPGGRCHRCRRVCGGHVHQPCQPHQKGL